MRAMHTLDIMFDAPFPCRTGCRPRYSGALGFNLQGTLFTSYVLHLCSYLLLSLSFPVPVTSLPIRKGKGKAKLSAGL